MDNALVITADPPQLRGTGSNVRQAYLLRALAQTIPTDLVVASRGEVDPELVPVFRRVIMLRPPAARTRGRWRTRLVAIRQALVTGPSERDAWRDERRLLARWWREQDQSHWDLVAVEQAGLARILPRRRPQPWVLSIYNLASERAREQLIVTSGRPQRLLVRREVNQARREERRLTARWDQVICVSNLDAALLHGPVRVVANGADIASISPTPLPDQPIALFTGALDTLPNLDAVRWFLSDIWPTVKAQVPGATVMIAGRRPLPELRNLCETAPGVELHADIPDMHPLLRRARLVVVPIRMGSGTRLKALDGLAAARLVIGTTIGLEGLDLVAGESAWIADTRADFARSVVRGLENSPEAQTTASRGRVIAERHYDWTLLGEQFVAVLAAVSS